MSHPDHTEIRRQERNIPGERSLAFKNFLALFWEQPISTLTKDGQPLPGVSEIILEVDPQSMTLSEVLTTELSSDVPLTFPQFQEHLHHLDPKAKDIVSRAHQLCPNPELLLQAAPTELNWVPWEVLIAYGDKLASEETEAGAQTVLAKMRKVIIGESYLPDIHRSFERGKVPKKRIDILVGRQNADPQVQGVVEAISNALDAVGAREKIGQFGLGVKQLLSLLESGQGELIVLTKSKQGEVLKLRARRGFNQEFFINFSSATEADHQQFSEPGHGTIISVEGLDLDTELTDRMQREVRERFAVVPEAEIVMNGEQLGQNIAAVSGVNQETLHSHGRVSVEVTSQRISIRDTGSGMETRSLFKMFMPGQGKGYRVLERQEVEQIARQESHVLFTEETPPRIVFSRNREAVFSIPVPKDRLNTSSLSMHLELGKILKVSEGREGFQLDENFAVALPLVIEKVLNDNNLQVELRAAFLNSVMLGLDQLINPATTGNEADTQTEHLIRRLKATIREIALPYLREVNQPILPNFKSYARIRRENVLYIDPFLLQRVERDIPSILRREGYPQLTEQTGIKALDGWRVFTAPLTTEDSVNQLFEDAKNGSALSQLRESYKERVPAVIDAEHNLVIVDEEYWKAITEEENVEKKAIMEESLQALLNRYVLTSYEAYDPRTVFITTPENKAHQNILDEYDRVSQTERDIVTNYNETIRTMSVGKHLFYLVETGTLTIINPTTKEKYHRFVPELKNQKILFTKVVDDRVTISCPDGTVITLNEHGQTVDLEKRKWKGQSEPFAIEKNKAGMIFTANLDSLDLYLPQQDFHHRFTEDELLEIFQLHEPIFFENAKLHISEDNLVYMIAEGNLFLLDPIRRTGMSLTNSNSRFEDDATFFESDGKVYVANITQASKANTFNRQAIFQTRNTVNQNAEVSIYEVITGPTLKIEFVTEGEFDQNNIVSIGPGLNGKGLTISTKEKSYIYDPDALGEDSKSVDDYLYKEFIHPEVDEFQAEMVDTVTFSELLHHVKEVFNDDELSSYPRSVLLKISRSIGTLGMIESDQADYDFLEERAHNVIQWSDNVRLLLHGKPGEQIQQFWNDLEEHYSSAGATPQTLIELKTRFAGNIIHLSRLNEDTLTDENLVWLFTLENPDILLRQSPHVRKELFSILTSLEAEDWILFSKTCEYIFAVEPAIDPEIFITQYKKILSKPRVKIHFFNLCQKLEQSGHPSLFSFVDAQPERRNDSQESLNSYLTFLTNRAELLREVEAEDTSYGEDVLPPEMPLALLVHLRATEGLATLAEVRNRIAEAGGVDQLLSQLNISQAENRVTVAIQAQATELGVNKREPVQNALDAILKSGKERGDVTIDFYLRSSGLEYVEEIIDTGTGVKDWIAMWTPGVFSKQGEQGARGFFGSGLFKVAEDVDAIEVDTVVEEAGKHVRYVQKLRTIKNSTGQVTGLVQEQLKRLDQQTPTETHTRLRLIRSTEDHLPELETMISKSTYKAMIGLATSPEVTGMPVQFWFMNDENERESFEVPVSVLNHYKTSDGNEIRFVKSSLTPTMTSGGLRMSNLSTPLVAYLGAVPQELSSILLQEKVSVILPTSWGLILDRSRLADEERYLPELQAAILTESMKLAGESVLDNENTPLARLLSQDLLTSQNYEQIYKSGIAKEAYVIAQKLSQSEILSAEDIYFVQQKNNFILVLAAYERVQPNGKKDSLLRRYLVVQRTIKKNDAQAPQSSPEQVIIPYIDEEETELSTVFVEKSLTRLVSQAKALSEVGTTFSSTTSIEDTPLTQDEITLLRSFFNQIGFNEVYFVPTQELGAAGIYTPFAIYLADHLLTLDPRERLEVIIHENAHLFESRARGFTAGELDSDNDPSAYLSHQQDGPFGDYYKVGAWLMLENVRQAQLNAN